MPVIFAAENNKLPVAKFRMAKKKMTLVRREIRLLPVAVRTLTRCIQQTFFALACLYGLLVTRGSPMQNRFLSGGKIHRAEGAEVRCRLHGLRDLVLPFVLGDVTGQLMTLKRDQGPEDLGAQMALDTLLIHVRRGIARDMTALFGV